MTIEAADAKMPAAETLAAALSPAWRQALARFAILIAAGAALFAPTIIEVVGAWTASSTYHHGFLVAPTALWLIGRRGDWRCAAPRASVAGLALIAVSVGFFLVGRAASVSLVTATGLVVLLIGAAVTAFGPSLARRWAFALAILFFMIPAGEEVLPFLQDVAARVVSGALNFTGVEATRDGFMITTAAGRFHMAEACAGLRFLLAAGLMASVAAYVSFADWRRQAAFVAACLVVALIANWIRAYLLVAVATLSDRRLGVGVDHLLFGWVFYGALLIALAMLARRFADRPVTAARAAPPQADNASPARAAFAGLALLAGAFAYDRLVVSTKPAIGAVAPLPFFNAPGWAIVGADVWLAHAPAADARLDAVYFAGRRRVSISAVYFVVERAGAEAASSAVRADDGEVWRLAARSVMTVRKGNDARAMTIDHILNDKGERRAVARLYWLGDRVYASPARLKLDVTLNALRGRREGSGVLFVAADPAQGDAPTAIEQFLIAVEPIAAWRRRIAATTE